MFVKILVLSVRFGLIILLFVLSIIDFKYKKIPIIPILIFIIGGLILRLTVLNGEDFWWVFITSVTLIIYSLISKERFGMGDSLILTMIVCIEGLSALIETMIAYQKNAFVLENKYDERMHEYYLLHDKKNSERVYREIKSKCW